MHCSCATLSSVACPAIQYFFTLFHKRHDFRKIFIELKMCGLVLSTILYGMFLIVRRIEQDMIIHIGTGKGKIQPRTGHEGPEGE